MSKEMQSLILNKEDENRDANLENLLDNYIKKSEELEERESKVLQRVELVQSAIASLQAWRSTRKSSTDLAPLDLKEIEEETKQIREETQKIKEEIERKMVENDLLEKEVERRKTLENEKEMQPTFQSMLEDEAKVEKLGMEEIESRESEPLSFKKKLMELEEMEKKLKKELTLGSEEFRKKCKSQSEKVDLLEWESLSHKEFIENLKKQDT